MPSLLKIHGLCRFVVATTSVIKCRELYLGRFDASRARKSKHGARQEKAGLRLGVAGAVILGALVAAASPWLRCAPSGCKTCPTTTMLPLITMPRKPRYTLTMARRCLPSSTLRTVIPSISTKWYLCNQGYGCHGRRTLLSA